MLRSRAGTELLIEGVVRIVDWASYKNAGEGQLSTGNFLYFVLRELASTHAAEYTVCMVVRHRFSPFSVVDFLLQTHWEIHLSKPKRGSIKPTEQGIRVQRDRVIWVAQKSQNGTRDGACDLGGRPVLDHNQQSAISNQCSARKMSPQISADKR